MFDTEPESHWMTPLLDLLAAFGVSQLELLQHLQEAMVMLSESTVNSSWLLKNRELMEKRV